MLNMIVFLDDFTVENGATWLMWGGHREESKPSEDEFFGRGIYAPRASQITGRAGSVLMFNSNLWHAAGANRTNWPRRSVTPLFARPFIKPGFDYCRAIDVEPYSEWIKQLLGYYSRIPSTYDEWYQPLEKRMYRSNQG